MKDMFEPLSNEELEWLDDFLLNRIDQEFYDEGVDEGVLNVSDLDGLLTAVVSGPVLVPPSQWLPQVWGDFQPAWKDEQEIDNLRHAIAPNAREIHGFWLARRSGDVPTATIGRSEPKVGRNDPCLCGSGKKFKKCCLH